MRLIGRWEKFVNGWQHLNNASLGNPVATVEAGRDGVLVRLTVSEKTKTGFRACRRLNLNPAGQLNKLGFDYEREIPRKNGAKIVDAVHHHYSFNFKPSFFGEDLTLALEELGPEKISKTLPIHLAQETNPIAFKTLLLKRIKKATH